MPPLMRLSPTRSTPRSGRRRRRYSSRRVLSIGPLLRRAEAHVDGGRELGVPSELTIQVVVDRRAHRRGEVGGPGIGVEGDDQRLEDLAVSLVLRAQLGELD